MFTLVTTYDDSFSKSETCGTIVDVFSAAAIYAYDDECISIFAINNATKEFVVDFTRG